MTTTSPHTQSPSVDLLSMSALKPSSFLASAMTASTSTYLTPPTAFLPPASFRRVTDFWKRDPCPALFYATETTVVDTSKSLRHKLQLHQDLLAPKEQPLRQPAIVGHRGALYDELENTRAGFLRCAELNCDAVELDVFLLKDETLVVFHGGGTDENPGDLSEYMLSQDSCSILDLTYPECLGLQFNPHFAEFPCPHDKIASGVIPTLEQVLMDLKDRCHVKIELKGPGTTKPVLELVERLEMVDQCSYSSFDHGRLKLLRDLRPHKNENGKHIYPTGALFNDVPPDYLQVAQACGATEIHLRYDTCNKQRINEIHSSGFGSMAWFRGPVGMKEDMQDKFWDVGNEDASCYQAIFESGVEQVCLNNPALAMAILAPAPFL